MNPYFFIYAAAFRVNRGSSVKVFFLKNIKDNIKTDDASELRHFATPRVYFNDNFFLKKNVGLQP